MIQSFGQEGIIEIKIVPHSHSRFKDKTVIQFGQANGKLTTFGRKLGFDQMSFPEFSIKYFPLGSNFPLSWVFHFPQLMTCSVFSISTKGIFPKSEPKISSL